MTAAALTWSTWKVSVFGVILACIVQHSDWIRRDTVSLHIQPECGKIRTRISPSRDNFDAVFMTFFVDHYCKRWASDFSSSKISNHLIQSISLFSKYNCFIILHQSKKLHGKIFKYLCQYWYASSNENFMVDITFFQEAINLNGKQKQLIRDAL